MYRGDLIAEIESTPKSTPYDLHTKWNTMYRSDLSNEQKSVAAIEEKHTRKHTSK